MLLKFISTGIALLTFTSLAFGAENLAAGIAVTYTPAPNYSLATDSGDSHQLTDGKLANVKQKMWIQKTATVGWLDVAHTTMTLDLGHVKPIRSVAIHIAAGLAGVHWPKQIRLLVSDDGKTFHYLGQLTWSANGTKPPTAHGYQTHWFKSPPLKAHGRYVALIAQPDAHFFFTDEIRVLAGSSASLSNPLPGPVITNPTAHFQQTLTRNKIRRRIKKDIHTITSRIEVSSLAHNQKQALLGQLQHLRQRMKQNPASLDPVHGSILPVNKLERQVMAVWGQYLGASGLKPLTMRAANLWDNPAWIGNPAKHTDQAHQVATVWAMRGETRCAAINLTNATGRSMRVRVGAWDLPSGAGLKNIRKVIWTDTRDGFAIADALVKLTPQDRGIVTIAAGVTRQIWLTFKPTASGRFTGRFTATVVPKKSSTSRDREQAASAASPQSDHLHARLVQNASASVALHVNAFDLSFPKTRHFYVGGWDYTDRLHYRGITPDNHQALISLLQRFGVNTPWATPKALPWGRFDNKGNMVQPPDMSRFDRWVKWWPDAARYVVFRVVRPQTSLDGLKPGTPAFNKAIRQWISYVVNHAKSLGIKPEQLMLHLIDEPRTMEMYHRAGSWAQAIQAADTGVVLWTDPVPPRDAGKDQRAVPVKFRKAFDVFCFNQSRIRTPKTHTLDVCQTLRRMGKTLAIYGTVGPMKEQDPYAYVRLQAWLAWKIGANASSFWSFIGNQGVSDWNVYKNPSPTGSYTPLFLDKDSATPAKQLAAMRAGAGDYEYLYMLKHTLAQAQKYRLSKTMINSGQALLDHAANRVLDAGDGVNESNLLWTTTRNRAVADQVRVRIGKWLEQARGTDVMTMVSP